jgi:hypothetical protein
VRPAADLPPPRAVATARFATVDGLRVTLRCFAQGKADWVVLDASGTGKTAAEAVAIGARVGRWVYAIPADRARLLRIRLTDLVAVPAKGS